MRMLQWAQLGSLAMVVTEVWLEVKNGKAFVVDATTARKQHKRWSKKRKGNLSIHAANKRKRSNNDTIHPVHDCTEGDMPVDENHQLFADAQAQLQQEMMVAGFGADALPMSFGSTNATSSSRKRQRQRYQQSSTLLESAPLSVPVKKVHVTFDSDGEITDRMEETIAVPDGVALENDTQRQEADRSDTIETAEDEHIATAEPSVDPTVFKFWKQRRTLFHQYDKGIQLDHESWYSVTPEAIAYHIATRCACDMIVDPFSGCGGNVIQFAKTCKQVIAIEIDAEKIRMAKANAAIYGVADRIEWIHGDALTILPTLQADVVFLSPPWGGMNYNRSRFGLNDMKIGETSGVDLFAMARRVTKNVVYYLPKTTPEEELQALAPNEGVECEHIHLNGQLKVVNAYYGDLAVPTDKDELTNDKMETTDGVQDTSISIVETSND